MEFVNELKPEFMGMHSLVRFSPHNSGSRGTMSSAHIAQHLVIEGLEEPYVHTGVLQEFGKHTLNVKMPYSGKILKIIPRYPVGAAHDSLEFNPETIVIYEIDNINEDDPSLPRETAIDYFTLPHYASYHQTFGFTYEQKEGMSRLVPGAHIRKGTVFLDTPAVKENNSYTFGVNLETAFMSTPGVSEDGMVIAKSALPKLGFKTFDKRVVEFGSKSFPLNLYGTTTEYKPFPDIGSRIRDDGVLMVLREYDSETSPVDMSVYDVLEIDHIFDDVTYVRGGGAGKIIDIKVISNNLPRTLLPEPMKGHVDKYKGALLKFYHEIVETEKQLRRENKRKFGEDNLRLTPAFSNLVTYALAITNHPDTSNPRRGAQNLNLTHKRQPLDEYRIEFVIEYDLIPAEGGKLTDCHGGKGVIVKIMDDEDMPVDVAGNRAELILGPEAVISRMNLGRLFEHYVNAVARDMTNYVKNTLGVHNGIGLDDVAMLDPKKVATVYDRLLKLYSIASPIQYETFSNLAQPERLEHIYDILNDKVMLFMPVGDPRPPVDVMVELEKEFKPVRGPVTYTGLTGKRVTTEEAIRIAPLYIMHLEKTPDDWSAVSSPKLQLFGVPATPIRSEKYRYPYRMSPVRAIGETEARIYTLLGPEIMAELMDRSNNTQSQLNIIWSILNADKPTNIDRILDPEHIQIGNTKPLALLKHILMCAGIEIAYEPGKLWEKK